MGCGRMFEVATYARHAWKSSPGLVPGFRLGGHSLTRQRWLTPLPIPSKVA
jgi:hypothetical protein